LRAARSAVAEPTPPLAPVTSMTGWPMGVQCIAEQVS
jgi:hypothetical protein